MKRKPRRVDVWKCQRALHRAFVSLHNAANEARAAGGRRPRRIATVHALTEAMRHIQLAEGWLHPFVLAQIRRVRREGKLRRMRVRGRVRR